MKHCSHCRQPGHQFGTCALWRAANPDAPPFKHAPAPRGCRLCGEKGHYAKTCRRARVDVALHLSLVDKVARRLGRRLPAHIEFDELVAAGRVGLMEAAKRFDSTKNDNFEAFAEFRIQGAMRDHLRDQDSLSRDMRRFAKEILETTRALEAQLGRAPDPGEIAAGLGIGIDELYERQKKLSGSTVVGIDDAGPDLLDRVPNNDVADPFEVAALREEVGQLVALIDDLPEQMRLVLSLYYAKSLTLWEIGEVIGVSESRVCQIHGEALDLVRAAVAAKQNPKARASWPLPILPTARRIGPQPAPTTHGRRLCGICREPGHRRETCSRRAPEVVARPPAPPAAIQPPPYQPATWDRSDPEQDLTELVEPDATPAPAPPTEEPAPTPMPPPPADDVVDVPIVMLRLRQKAHVNENGRVRGRSLASHHLTRDELRLAVEYPDDIERPLTRGDCQDQPRPCPWVSCSHHLYLDVNPKTGTLRFNFPHLQPEEMTESCVLDVADRDGQTLEAVGEIMGLTRERIRQIETTGLEAMAEARESSELSPPIERHASPLAGAQTL